MDARRYRNAAAAMIAEGIETWDQLAFLRAEHCAEGQGYFSRPLPAPQFTTFLETAAASTLIPRLS